MAVYKVPQDVEAEDKLIGPFSFRQFIYLIIAALGMLIAWGLSQIFIGLLIIPLPIIVTFLVLALPLRKDQPMETYVTAVIRFYLKPRVRLWVPEGTISLVSITAPKTVEYALTKGFSGSQASQQLSYLAQVVDSQGWSTRGVTGVSQTMNDIVVAEARSAEDVLDDNANVARSFDQRITQTNETRRQQTLQSFQAAASQPVAVPPTPQPLAPAPQQLSQPAASPLSPGDTPNPSFNPYPNSMHQHVLSPAGELAVDTPATSAPAVTQTAQSALVTTPTDQPSVQTVSPDIIRLANNNDLSISALAHEAHRLGSEGEEVEISLR